MKDRHGTSPIFSVILHSIRKMSQFFNMWKAWTFRVLEHVKTKVVALWVVMPWLESSLPGKPQILHVKTWAAGSVMMFPHISHILSPQTKYKFKLNTIQKRPIQSVMKHQNQHSKGAN